MPTSCTAAKNSAVNDLPRHYSEVNNEGPGLLGGAPGRVKWIRESNREFARLCRLPTSIAHVVCAPEAIAVTSRVNLNLVLLALGHVTLHDQIFFDSEVELGPNVVPDFSAFCFIDLGLPRPETKASEPTPPLNTQVGGPIDYTLILHLKTRARGGLRVDQDAINVQPLAVKVSFGIEVGGFDVNVQNVE